MYISSHGPLFFKDGSVFGKKPKAGINRPDIVTATTATFDIGHQPGKFDTPENIIAALRIAQDQTVFDVGQFRS
jgi:hypothetical protein